MCVCMWQVCVHVCVCLLCCFAAGHVTFLLATELRVNGTKVQLEGLDSAPIELCMLSYCMVVISQTSLYKLRRKLFSGKSITVANVTN